MASSIEVVPIVASAVASDIPSEILPVKRVRKAILKPKSPETPATMPKIQQKSEETSEAIPATVAKNSKNCSHASQENYPGGNCWRNESYK